MFGLQSNMSYKVGLQVVIDHIIYTILEIGLTLKVTDGHRIRYFTHHGINRLFSTFTTTMPFLGECPQCYLTMNKGEKVHIIFRDDSPLTAGFCSHMCVADYMARIAPDYPKEYLSVAFAAEAEFDRIHIHKGFPETMEEYHGVGQFLVECLVLSGLVESKGKARRLLTEGGVRVDGVKVFENTLLSYCVLQVGKRNFRRIK